jgi:asparagine synthase (glutamine-hydrolysing)
MVWWTDDLIADVAGYGYYAVMRKAREMGIPVMLQGHGGDEMFWGYPWVQESVARACAARAGLAGRPRAPLPSFEVLPNFRAAAQDMPGLWGRRFREELREAAADAPLLVDLPWERPDVLRPAWSATCICSATASTRATGWAWPRPWSSGSLVDYRLVETVTACARRGPTTNCPPRPGIKEALVGILPGELLGRPKRGFTPPVDVWMRALRDHYGADLRDGLLVERGVFDPGREAELLDDRYVAWRGSPLFYKTLVLERWLRAMSAAQQEAAAQARAFAAGEREAGGLAEAANV